MDKEPIEFFVRSF